MNELSKKELSILLEIILACVSCKSLKMFHEIVADAVNLLQSGNIVFLSSQEIFPKQPGDIKEINISYPAKWTDLYRSQKFVKIDPITNIREPGLYYWEHVYRIFPPDKSFYSQAKSFGLNNGFSHIFKHDNKYCLMSVADEKLSNNRRVRTIVNYLAPHFHQLVAKLTHQHFFQKLSPLTPREREVLLWAMEGKTNWEISVILGISQESSKEYIKNIMHKLNASNRAHAVAIALQQNLLSPIN